MAEGPSMIGMSLISQAIAERSSVEKARNLILPAKNIEHSQGNLYSGYKRKTHYENLTGGNVTCRYQRIYGSKLERDGRITMEVQDGKNGRTIAETYFISLPSIV